MDKINSFSEYQEQYKKSVDNPDAFWSEQASTFLWKKKWDRVLDWEFKTPSVNWFINGKLNITENCLDRHLDTKADKTAIIWEPNNPDEKHKEITYKELHEKVCRFSNVLKANGAKKGDRICLYMPMVPELAIATLACARIGAIHSVVFAGFSAKALSDRINDADCNILVTSDGLYRGKKQMCLKDIVDDALQTCPTINSCIVLQRTGQQITMKDGRDSWWHEEDELVNSICDAEIMDSEDPLFVLYTSGSTGKPKGVQHHCGGYMVYAEYSFRNVFQYNEDDVYWCTADIGWITGHTYIVYGPLLAGSTTIMFEGVPTYPDAGRFWEVCEKFKVNLFYTAPTAIRALQVYGTEFIDKYDLSSLKTLGSVGEPINEEAWDWYYKNIGKENCWIVDTWWQTETGGIMISPLAHITKMKPTFAALPLPGIQPCLVDPDGKEILGNDVQGNLCIKYPWPSMIRTTYGDHERCKQVYFSTYPGMYFTGDGCRRDEDGFYRITGRVDDVINVSGHRMGTAEVENGINEHSRVVESAVVGFPHEIKGQGIYAYVILEDINAASDNLRKEILSTITKEIGPIAKPDKIQFVSGLPKTRSGKIMRRILRKVAEGDTSSLGDTSTLLDPSIVAEIIEGKV
ncbi:MAG: acetate--CoA ligase [Crocinitomicaceae bacterium]|nr:acetate--CoA ligase [Crocinitomicaceae bacterium]|tara:strand:+ start:6711 stop:8603 length:1893 start_codon:yes stop_codon:yes gene_type:complete